MGKARLEAIFVSQAGATPDRVAILHQGRRTTYRELDRISNKIARHLAGCGTGPTTLVAVCLQRSADMIACLLGVLKAGAAYVPLDPEYPRDRIGYILEDSRADILIAQEDLVDATRFSGRLITPGEWGEGSVEDSNYFVTPGDAESLAYIIYTSGTTGNPKGVMLAHTASALVTWARESFTEQELSRVAATSSICFDPSILEIFVPLCLGGTVVLKANSLEPFSAAERPTMMNVVPAVLELLLKNEALPDSLQVINVGGERVRATLTRRVCNVLPHVRLFLHYGPTEATTTTTVALVERDAHEDPSIGWPICDARVYILDEAKKMVAAGVTGEIYIAGPTLAKGYRNRPKLTSEAFLEDIDRSSGERMYRTGDLGCWAKDGSLRYVGRTDDQIKFRGVRIELGEIEANLRAIAPVENAAVAVRIDPTGRERLVAYIEAGEAFDAKRLREQLEQKLPRQMLPSHFVRIYAWPLNLSGKVDRFALPSPVWGAQHEGVALAENALQDLIANSFRYAVGVQHVALDDDFFDVGGDSLLAEEVMLELEQMLGISISATVFAQNSTPRLLAANCYVEPVMPAGHMVSLQPEGSGHPLFCTPDVFGMPLSFMSIARALAPNQPVYGLSAGPLEDAMIRRPCLKMLTRAYVQEIKALQPEGPYQVCGYSFGCTAAFDLAQALRAEGDEVALILLDSVIYQRAPRLRAVLSILKGQGPRRTAFLLKRSRLEWLKTPQLIFDWDIPDWVPESKRRLALACAKARATYRYAPFDGDTLLVESAQPDKSHAALNNDGMLGWNGLLTGRIVRVQAETSHAGMVRDPYTRQLAATVQTFLEDFQSERQPEQTASALDTNPCLAF